MGRPKSTLRFHVYINPDSPRWYVWWIDRFGTKHRKSTKFERAHYSREMVEREVNKVDPTYQDAGDRGKSVTWLCEWTLDRLEMEDRYEKTLEVYRNSFTHLAAAIGGETLITTLTEDTVLRLRQHCRSLDHAPATMNIYLKHLRAAMTRAVRAKMLPENPFANIRPLKTRKNHRTLTLEEARRFVESLQNDKNPVRKHLLLILLFTGMRRGEILRVRRQYVELYQDNDTGTAGRMMIENIKPPEQPKRWLAIHPAIRDSILFFLNRSEHTLPFAVVNPMTITNYAKVALKEAGLGEFHTHSLRHTFSTLALENGLDIRTLQRQLGHQHVTTTEVYLHEIGRGPAPDIGL